jgi:acyl transferase domain-containing protein
MTNHFDIAIVGQGVVCPGADSTDPFWMNINARRGFALEVQPNRWAAAPAGAISNKLVPDKAIGGCACLITDPPVDLSGLRIPAALAGLAPLYYRTLQAGR